MTDLTPIEAALRGAQASRPARTPLGRGLDQGPVLVLVDGEHYPSAVADTIADLIVDGWDIRAAVLVGGTEKLRSAPDYGVELISAHDLTDSSAGPVAILMHALSKVPDTRWILDLADEPMLVLERRLELIAVAAGKGVAYRGADTTVLPPVFTHVGVPTVEIVGTGKRIGKTAVSAHLARLADQARGGNGSVIVLAMGRGGPATPVVVDRAGGSMTVDRLLELSRSGLHAASDYLEDAALTGLTTVGCRRVGGGILGVPVGGNVLEGARLAAALSPDLIIVEGSGACTPPIKADRTLLLSSTARPQDLLSGLGSFRIGRSDLILVQGNDLQEANEMVRQAQSIGELLGHSPRVIPIQLRPAPVGDVRDRRVAIFTTAPESVSQIIAGAITEQGADVALISHNLADREPLTRDLQKAVEVSADVLLVEIKAAAIDAVAEFGARHGIEVMLLDNQPVSLDPTIQLDDVLREFSLVKSE